MNSSEKAALTGAVRGTIHWEAPLSEWTSFRVGGPADALVTLRDGEDLQGVLHVCEALGLAWKVVGRGSNILAADDGYRGVVLVLGEGFRRIERRGPAGADRFKLWAGGGVGLIRLSTWCAVHGFSGFEFASGIPGSVGGGVAMNAGGWGREMADVVVEIELVDHENIDIISDRNLEFGYRVCRTLARHQRAVVTGAGLLLSPAEPAQVKETIRTLSRRRKARQPLGLPSCGSVFRNPEGLSAGRLIDEAGLKGRRIGDAEVSAVHANFIVNRGRATARDILALIDEIRRTVLQHSGVELKLEVEILS